MRNEEVGRALGTVEGKCNLILTRLDSHKEDIDRLYGKIENKTKSLETKVATLEKKQYSIFALGGLLFSTGLVFLRKFLP
jgi:hypothetical protein